jgi:hypothetical protein
MGYEFSHVRLFSPKGNPKKVARDLGIADERTGPNGSLHILE